MIRVPFLVPRLGERYAELLEMPFMFVAIVLAARHVVRRFDLPARLPLRLQVGFVALALSVVAELLLATVLQGRSLPEFIASRDPVSGSVYLVMLMLFALYILPPALQGFIVKARWVKPILRPTSQRRQHIILCPMGQHRSQLFALPL